MTDYSNLPMAPARRESGVFGLDVTGRPRAFVDLNVSFPMTTETQLARRGTPYRGVLFAGLMLASVCK